MAALAEHRPEIHRLLQAAIGDESPYSIVRGKGGRLTIAEMERGELTFLCQNRDPVGAVVKACGTLGSAIAQGAAIAMMGIGDGWVLSALGGPWPALPLGRQRALFIIEPDARLVLLALALHDFSGPDGAIQSPRFYWFIGPNWPAEFRRLFETDVYAMFPSVRFGHARDRSAIEAEIEAVQRELENADRRLEETMRELYRQTDSSSSPGVPEEEKNSHRPPRVLFATSRFTTVLQYSTADAAEAFRKLGWETRLLIEPAAHQLVSRRAMCKAALEFKPDLVFVIDHLRHEYGDIFPANLPFTCWIQDRLPNLCDAGAAGRVGPTDFVLTPSGSYFVRQFDYPARQIVDTPNLGRAPLCPESWESDGLDIAYTSNWSTSGEEIIDDLMSQAGDSPQLRAICEAGVARIVSLYDRDESLATAYDVRAILAEAQNDAGITITDPILMDRVVNLFFDKLNSHLFRFQALKWVVELAERRGLQLGLFGRGWDRHPRFARFARGFIKPGADLENLVRSTKINLQLEPWGCCTHSRLLNGLFAGGFFLIRDHPFNHLPNNLLDFLTHYLPVEVETTEQARAAVPPTLLPELDRLLHHCRALGEQADAVQTVRNMQRSGLIVAGRPPMLGLSHVVFHDRADLERQLDRFLADPDLRRRLARLGRNDLRKRLSYQAGMKRAVEQIRQRLTTSVGMSK